MIIKRCKLFDGEPYIVEKEGKFHVLQGNMTTDCVKEWYDTEGKAVSQWNNRIKSAKDYEDRTLIKSKLSTEEKADRMKEFLTW